MADKHRRGPDGEPVPRDLPDQVAGEGEDRWDATPDLSDEDEPATDVPDTDEAGTGRQGAPHSTNVHPEHPEPQEPSG
ncbi:hypothetical protein ACIGMX_02320 [Streptomyces aquilus]|uniref:Uncharacterized protein n=1 Tax=Streptomyces aquilus TaxID=2548456 RepID=A0A3Q9C4T5_9ACTN|nr:hypothetical protein [Streptomyces aquilus]AZP21940.1 hypothetical protein EJC51_41145 [Streptomyces aquilus]